MKPQGLPSEGTESPAAKRGTESPAIGEQLMEEVCERENCKQALERVKANKGSAGVDGMTVHELPEFLKQHWPAIREQLLSGTYKPQPVKRVEIPKPDGGVRKLGIPTVLDRFIQQAVMQVLQRRWDRTFSDHSYGFRPGRSAHQAVEAAQQYIAEGYRWVVDLDLEKFFDRVNHDKLMAKIAERVSDKRMLKLIRAFLRAGVMEGGLVSPVDEGTPQGGPLSPLLSNIVLDEFDRELERRGLRFARYADDSNIYVRSRRAGERVMDKHYAIHHDEAQAQGERAEECGGAAVGTEVSGLQLHERRHTKAADRAESGGPVQGAGSGTDAPDARCEHRTDGRRTGPVSDGAGSATSGSVKRLRCCKVLRSGSGAGCGLRSGSSGSGGRCGSPNCANGVWAKISPLKRRAALMVRGGWRTARHSASRCPMLTSTRSGFRD